jgi:Ca-activated chloride channel family protein
MRGPLAAIAFLFAVSAVLPAHAEWSWLRSENEHVNEGNQKLNAGDAKGALESYDKAARELPSEGGVHLDRGLALLKQGDQAKARDALKLGAQSRATPAVRADAHYDLGVSFYKEADAAAGKDDHEQAQKLFREAADAFKQALRLRPGDRSAAWNYELAARRIREQQEKQKQKEEQDKQKQDQDKKNPDQQKQDQQNQDQQNQDQQKQDQDQQQKQDQQKQDQDQQKQDKQKQDQDQQKQDQQKQDQAQHDQQQAQQAPQPRPEAERALDALQDGEENLERIKALQRAARERREPEKDW